MPKYSKLYKKSKQQLIRTIVGQKGVIGYMRTLILEYKAEQRINQRRLELLQKKLEFIQLKSGNVRSFPNVTKMLNKKKNGIKRRDSDKARR